VAFRVCGGGGGSGGGGGYKYAYDNYYSNGSCCNARGG